uniref:Uncharacterized protein n=1 Tax=Arundo donax TaxID=35708 RepID=A0A0A9CXQ1_ARUDO
MFFTINMPCTKVQECLLEIPVANVQDNTIYTYLGKHKYDDVVYISKCHQEGCKRAWNQNQE